MLYVCTVHLHTHLLTNSMVNTDIHSFFSGGDIVINIIPGASPSRNSKANFKSEREGIITQLPWR